MGEQQLTPVNRGSEWHRWEPHIHAPGTILSDQFGGDEAWEPYLQALEAASPTLKAIGVTDYCVTSSYEEVKAAKEQGRLPNCELLFPNVELRLDTGTVKGNFVNIHLLVSPDDPHHVHELNRFLGQLHFRTRLDKFACTPVDLTRLGHWASETPLDDKAALKHGCLQFKVSRDDLVEAYRSFAWAQNNILIAVAGGADGSSGVKDAADKVLRTEIEGTAHIIFASSPQQQNFWRGDGKASRAELLQLYGGAKPCLWGCDAHSLERVGKPDENRLCWIKGAATFAAVKQACVDPERAFVGETPPAWATESQVIDHIAVRNAPWAETPLVCFNHGLVAVIGARGSGKTALADMVAAGCDAYTETPGRSSFLSRAREHLGIAEVELHWLGDTDIVTRPLAQPISAAPETSPRARYLSQQFVEHLCSPEGMPSLIAEIERVIFQAHPVIERDGAVSFEELLQLRASVYRDARRRQEQLLASVSEQIGVEMEKSRQVPLFAAQVAEKERLIAGYEADRRLLIPKQSTKDTERLQALMAAAETVRSNIRYFTSRQSALNSLANEVRDLKQNRAPNLLRQLRETYKTSGFEPADWENFLLTYSGDVDALVATKTEGTQRSIRSWKGATPTKAVDTTGAFISADADLVKQPLAPLEAEITRLESIVATSKQTAQKLATITGRIVTEKASLQALKDKLDDAAGAKQRARDLIEVRQNGYHQVFEAVLGEERVLNELYAPLMSRLQEAGGTLSKLSFTVHRVADVHAWAEAGEDLFDLRGGPFKGIGTLEKYAAETLKQAWEIGTAAEVSQAMAAFRERHQEELLENAVVPRTDQANYRLWTRRFARWLYSTEHIAIDYGIQYNGVDIRKLSPGTRGIVLILMYLALDTADDRPLIIDQPEENLDPKSIYEELVPLFQAAKRKRQVIMVTHNANLVVNTDADQIIIADVGVHADQGLPSIRYASGGLEDSHVRELVCRILEGGEQAFRDRARRLQIAFS